MQSIIIFVIGFKFVFSCMQNIRINDFSLNYKVAINAFEEKELRLTISRELEGSLADGFFNAFNPFVWTLREHAVNPEFYDKAKVYLDKKNKQNLRYLDKKMEF